MDLLTPLGLSKEESGTYLGQGQWSSHRGAAIVSESPATGATLGTVYASTEGDYETIIERAQAAQE